MYLDHPMKECSFYLLRDLSMFDFEVYTPAVIDMPLIDESY